MLGLAGIVVTQDGSHAVLGVMLIVLSAFAWSVGTGQIAKICNNLLLGISMVGVSEAMALGDALGIDTQVLAGIINSSTGRCWSSDTYNPWPGVIETAPSSRGYTGGFGADLMLKDLGLATEAARQAKQPVILGAVAQQLYQSMSQRGEVVETVRKYFVFA